MRLDYTDYKLLCGVVSSYIQNCQNLVYQVVICAKELWDKVFLWFTYIYTAVHYCSRLYMLEIRDTYMYHLYHLFPYSDTHLTPYTTLYHLSPLPLSSVKTYSTTDDIHTFQSDSWCLVLLLYKVIISILCVNVRNFRCQEQSRLMFEI